MTDRVDAEFDLLKVSLGKSDATRAKADALKELISAAVQRGLEAGQLTGDPAQIPAAVQTTLRCLAGNLLVNGAQQSASGLVKPYLLLSKKYSQASPERSADTMSDADSGRPARVPAMPLQPASQDLSEGGSARRSATRSTTSMPDQGRLQLVNLALGELGLPAVNTKSDVAKLPAAGVNALCAYLQEHVDHDPTTGQAIDFSEDFVKVQGGFKHSKSGNATAADLKDGLRRFLSG